MLSTHISNLRKNEDFESFMVVIDVDKEDSKNLFRLIRNAENPEHNKLINKIESPAEDKKNIKKLFEELSEEIKCFLKPRDRNGSLVEMDLLEIPNKAEVQGSNTTRPRSQMLKAKPSANKSKPPISRIRTTDNSKKRPAPEIVSRSLEAKNSMRMKDKGNTIDVELNIVPQKMEVKDEVYLSMSLAQDKAVGGALYKYLRHQHKKYRKRYGKNDYRGRIPKPVGLLMAIASFASIAR
jgi:hypothetical protein